MKIILFANTDWFLYNFRLASAQALTKLGHSVIMLSPTGPYTRHMETLGFHCIDFPMERQGINVFRELNTVFRLIKIYLTEKPDLTHHFTIKCVLYGTLAAELASIPSIVNSLTGLGYAFTAQRNLLQRLISMFYHILLKKTWTIFENPDDQASFLKKGWVLPERSFVILGAGVDLERFKHQPEPTGTPVVTLPARLLFDKGIAEFVDAARIVRKRNPKVVFRIAGENDPGNPSNIPENILKNWKSEKSIEWQGWQIDMETIYAHSHIICLPSYREGLPKTLIEAAASGRAIITTDVPGCRHVVNDGENGFLVPHQDSVSLAEKIEILLNNPHLRKSMGIKGRARAESEFSNEKIISETIRVYQKACKNL